MVSPSLDLGTGAHIVGNIFLEKLQCVGAKNLGVNVKILDRQMRAWIQVHNPNVSQVKSELTINRLRESLGCSEAQSDSSRSEGVRALRLGASQTSS